MARRKKYQKLPNGYGSIRYLGSGRRNPYGVYPPVKEFDDDGRAVGRKAICYVDSWLKGFAVLTAYHAGNYTPGMERGLEGANTASVDGVLRAILSDYNKMARADKIEPQKGKTFKEVYQGFYNWKYEQNKSRKYSESSINSTKAAYRNCSALHDRIFSDLRHNDLQKVLDSCRLKHSSLELIKTLLRQMYAYAEIQEIVDKDYSAHIRINKPDDDEHGVPFSEDDLKKLWADKDDPVAEMLLIMCYSGYRINEYRNITVNTKEWYFQGGSKTAAGKRFSKRELSALPLITYPKGTILYEAVKKTLHPYPLNVFMDSQSSETIIELVKENFGIAFVPDYLIEPEKRSGILIGGFDSDVKLTVSYHYFPERPLTPQAKAFIAVIHEKFGIET